MRRKLMSILLLMCLPIFLNQIFNWIKIPKWVDACSYIIMSITLIFAYLEERKKITKK